MTSTFTAAPAFKDAFVGIVESLNAGTAVEVAFGHPGMTQAEEIISIGDITSEQEPAAFGSRRPREETLTLTVYVNVFRGGGEESEKVCSDRAYALLGAIEEYVRVTDTTVGNTVRACFMTSHASVGSTDPQVLASGRMIDITAVFTAVTRITS